MSLRTGFLSCHKIHPFPTSIEIYGQITEILSRSSTQALVLQNPSQSVKENYHI